MTPEITEALKKNLKHYSHLRVGERVAIESAGQSNVVYLNTYTGEWDGVGREGSLCRGDIIYRIRRNYQPEPEIVECEIFINGDALCYKYDGIKNPITIALCQPDFIGFKFEDGSVSGCPMMYTLPSTSGRYDSIKGGSCKVLHVTHVLFRKVK
jgi:hypothetical protein